LRIGDGFGDVASEAAAGFFDVFDVERGHIVKQS
jgi:hypothetical protein